MTTLGLPYSFEDTTGLISGPTDFLDIYDRPPFLRLDTAQRHQNQNQNQNQRPYAYQPYRRELAIFELGARTFVKSARHQPVSPLAVLCFDEGWRGSIRFQTNVALQLERWLKKSTTFGSTLTRQFKGSDGKYYQWSFKKTHEHEWTCIQLGTNYLVAHYDLKAAEQPRYRTSGNVLTVYENWIQLFVELLASLVVMRHIHAAVSAG